MVVSRDYSSEYVLRKLSEKKRIGSLASKIGILDDDFEDLLSAGNLSKYWYWCKNLGTSVQKNRYHYITSISFEE